MVGSGLIALFDPLLTIIDVLPMTHPTVGWHGFRKGPFFETDSSAWYIREYYL